MLIGVPKEIKNHEYRIGLTPASAYELTQAGHQVLIESSAGEAIGFSDQEYCQAGANIIVGSDEIFSSSEMIIKVKEPQPEECVRLHQGQILYTYLHLAPDPDQTKLLMESRATCIAYETVTDNLGGLPLLAPMSEVAGRIAVQAGAHHLEKTQGGLGVLLGGVPGVKPATVLIIGGGIVGFNAAQIAVGMGANVTLLDRSLPRLRHLDAIFNGRIKCIHSTKNAIEEYSQKADLVIGAVLVPGAEAPKLLTRKMIANMKKGAVVVDVAIDQGGCFETSRATTHQNPTYEVDGVIHYCVANMPGCAPRTSTLALNNATLPYALTLANNGLEALKNNPHLTQGLNVFDGKVTYQAVADALGHTYHDPNSLLR